MSSRLGRAVTGLLVAAALGAALPLSAPERASALYLSKTTARHQAWLRVRSMADGRFWVEPAPNCFRYSNVRVACEYAYEWIGPLTGRVLICSGNMVVVAYPDGWVTHGEGGGCG
jgi:hypothetical protein